MLHSILSNDRKLFEEYKRIVCESYATSDEYHELLERYQEFEKLDYSWIIEIAKSTLKLALFSIKVILPCTKGLVYLYANKYKDYKYVKDLEVPDNYLDLNLKHIYHKLLDVDLNQRKTIIENIECQPHVHSMLHEALNEQDYLWFRNIIFNNCIDTKNLSKVLLVYDLLNYKILSKLDDNESTQFISIINKIFLSDVSSLSDFMSMYFDFLKALDDLEEFSVIDAMVLFEHIVIFQVMHLLLFIFIIDFKEEEIKVIAQQLNLSEFHDFYDGVKEIVKILKFENRSNSYNIFITNIFKISNNEIEKLLGIESSFSLPNDYFELKPEKDESLYLGVKNNAIIINEGVESFSKLINFIVDNDYVKVGKEHNSSIDLKFDLAFKLTGKMRPDILCSQIIWTKSEYTNPLVAIAKGLGGNYDKLKDLFIIDSSYHSRLVSIYAERLHTGDKFTDFFYELYPKMNNKGKNTKKNNTAN